MNRLFMLLLALASLVPAFAQQEDSLTILRRPALNPSGDQLAFSYQGDLWTVSTDGGRATRLTIHEGYESYPAWSPDGSTLAFTSSRFGNNDVFTIKPEGTGIQQITYHSTNDNRPAWHGNDTLLFSTSRTYVQLEWEDEINKVSAAGGTPQLALSALGEMPAVSPDGRYIAFVKGACRLEREAYRGPANRDVWLYDTQNKTYQAITTDEGQDVYPDWGDNSSLYFLSARTGRYNVYKVTISEGKPQGEAQPITNFADEGVRYFDVSGDGNTLVLSKGVDIWVSPLDRLAPRRLSVTVGGDFRHDPVESKTLSNGVSDFALSPNEKQIALVSRGEIFVTKNDKEDNRTTTLTHHPYRDKEPVWLNDTTLLFLSDREGNFDLYLLRSADKDQPDLFRSLRHEAVRITHTNEDEEALKLSPDRTKIVYRQGRGTLLIADVDSTGLLSNTKTLVDSWAPASGLTWSPDSRWVAYAQDDLDFNEEIYILPIDGSREPTNVSLHPRGDSNPVWSKDGKKLGFVSNRNNGDNDVWFVWLRKEDWEKTKADWVDLEKDGDPEEEKPKKNGEEEEEKKEEGPEPVEIDFEDIHERLEQVTRLAGNEYNIQVSHDGETFFFVTNGGGWTGSGGKPALMRVKWDGSEMKTVLDNAAGAGGIQLDKEGKFLYMQKSGGLARVSVEGGAPESLPFSGRMQVNYREEYAQIFDEAWRSLEQGFYDPEFHGQDWEALRERYRPRALAASTDTDFRALVNEMLGQLNASHMGLYGGSRAETNKVSTGRIGVQVAPVADGVRILSVVPGTPADRSESKLEVGETILSVNEAPVAGTNFFRLLEGTEGQRTLLNVRGADGTEREVVIRPVSRINDPLYESWVKERKALTETYSGGRLGYIHVEAMGWSSFERFERELTAAGLGKDGILIDVRYNGGGWTTDMLMTVLNVRQHAYTIPRGAASSLDENGKFKAHYPYGERLPLSAWTKPSAALCNQFSYSNAEIFSHAFKTLGHGPLIGMPTFGAVISTGGQGLMNGHYVRMPFRAWYVLATGENMENGPAVPTHIVPEHPSVKGSGEDPQLKKAVEVLLQQIDE